MKHYTDNCVARINIIQIIQRKLNEEKCMGRVEHPKRHRFDTVEWGELGRWCELGQNFSESSPLLLLVNGHWCAMGQKFSPL